MGPRNGGRMGSGTRSACGTGRRRLRMEDAAVAAEMGSVTTRFLGGVMDGRDGCGGDGGGECWYVVALLYVVQEKRLCDSCLSCSGVSFFLPTIGSCGGVATRCGPGISLENDCSCMTVSGESRRWTSEKLRIPRPVAYVGDTGETVPRVGEFLPILRGTVGLMGSSCTSGFGDLSATTPVSGPTATRLAGSTDE